MRSPNTTPLLTDLRVQAVKESREEREEKTEQYSVLEGLRKYAANHVLLVGRPGSGKSTALVRLLLEESNQLKGLITSYDSEKSKSLTQSLEKFASLLRFSAQRKKREFGSSAPLLSEGKIGSIPILVELRNYDKSILDLIDRFLKAHQLKLDRNILNNLNSICPLLLFDGINELPTDKARQDLLRFRQQYPQISMIFTTRSIELGGNLEIEKKLEMLPLTEPQIIHFVRGYLPEKGDAMLKNLGDRLKEFGQTPLLLWMLCSVFQNNNQIPANLGLVFRLFIKKYDDELKKNVPTYNEESRAWWREILQVLAWKMTEGKSKKDIQVSISRREAENILSQFLQGKVEYPNNFAKQWLKDLLKYHLLQLDSNEKIAFCHQLIQEYYAAEALFEKLSILGDEELQWNYLNYLKWNEPVTLMLGVLEDETQAIRVVRLGLEVDIRLGATLAGKVAIEFQKQTVDLISRLNVPELIKVALLELTESNESINELLSSLNDSNEEVRIKSAEILGKIASDKAVSGLLKALDDASEDVREKVAQALGKISSETAISGLVKIVNNDPDRSVRNMAIWALGNIGSAKTVSILINSLDDSINGFSIATVWALAKIGSDEVIPYLIKPLEDYFDNDKICIAAVKSLVYIGSEAAITGLLKILENSGLCDKAVEAFVDIASKSAHQELLKALKNSDRDVSAMATEVLGKLGSEEAILGLLNALETSDEYIKKKAAEALGEIGSTIAIPGLLKALESTDEDVRIYAVGALGEIGSEAAIPGLLKTLNDFNEYVSFNAALALATIGSQTAIPRLVKALEEPDHASIWLAANALGKIKSEEAIPALIKKLNHPDRDIRHIVTETLGNINSEGTILGLLKSLEDSELYIRMLAEDALGKIKSKVAIQGLLKALEHSDKDVRCRAVSALGEIASDDAIQGLLKALKHSDKNVCSEAVSALKKIGSDDAIQGLLKALENSNEEVRFEAAVALAELGSDASIPELLKALEDYDEDVRSEAVSALGEIGSDDAIQGLLKALEDCNEDVRSEAVSALKEIGSDDAIQGLLKALENSNEEVRFEAAVALAELGSEASINTLINALDSSNEGIRFDAAVALAELGSEASVPELIHSLKEAYFPELILPELIHSLNEEHFIVTTGQNKTLDKVTNLLVKIGSENVISSLIKLLENPDWIVRDQSTKTLSNIISETNLIALRNALKNPDFAAANEGDTGIQAYTAITMVQDKLKYYQPKPQTMNQKAYISYNWQEDSNEIANQIVQAFEAKGIEVIRDKTHTSYKDSIKKFMQQIGQGQCVIVVISDRYLKSPNCMFELVEIAKNEDFYNRIFPIVLPDAKIYDDENRLDYYLYWEEKKAKLQDKYKKVDLLGTESIMETLKLYDDIRRNIDNLTHTFKVMNTLNKDLHRQSEFAEMIQAVEAKLVEDSQNRSVSPSHNPISSPQSITYDLRGATIGNLAHNVQGNQHTN
jgi:HEAT repeat protein